LAGTIAKRAARENSKNSLCFNLKPAFAHNYSPVSLLQRAKAAPELAAEG
jgi:hypothetical protein